MSEFAAGTLAWMLAEILLTGTMLALYLALRRVTTAASDRYSFLKLAFAIVVFLPWIPFPWAVFLTNGVTSAPSSMIVATAIKIQPVVASAPSAYAWLGVGLVTAYFVAVAIFAARIISSLAKLRRLTAASTFAFAHEGIPVYATDENLPPATFGLVRPIVLISRTILRRISDLELQMILAHELHHIKRRDYLFNLGKAFVQSILVFSPFIHKLTRAFVEEMELSCDALVVRGGRHDRRRYGGLLLSLSAETKPRTDLVYSGLFAANSFLSRRITAMRNVHAKSRKALWLAALGLFTVVAGPTVASLGIDSAVEKLIAPVGETGHSFKYQAKVVRANGKKESLSGTMVVVDGKEREIQLATLRVQVVSHKVSESWKFVIEIRAIDSNEVIQRATIITKESAQLEASSDDATGDDVKALSFSISPIITKAPGKEEKFTGPIHFGDMVRLNFKEPTDIRDVIETMSQISGKNIIVSHDIEGKITVVSDHPVSRKDALQAFLDALEQIDVVAVEEGEAIRLVRAPPASLQRP